MIKKIFTIARSDKKLRKKALSQLNQQGLIEANEVLGGKKDSDNSYGNDHFIRDQASNHINDNYQNNNNIF
ncbi:MAG: hypothetical protein RLZZ306_555 [Bacteroidota bacterium]|jgi:hypothetical protein